MKKERQSVRWAALLVLIAGIIIPRGWTPAATDVRQPITVLTSNLVQSTSHDEQEGDVRWILPGPRRLDPLVFGTPESPLGFEPDVGVPLAARLTNEVGTAFTTTANPTPFSNAFALIRGSYDLTAIDVTLGDHPSSQDAVAFNAIFTSPDGQHTYDVRVNRVLPVGLLHSVFGGVGVNMIHHGRTGIGTKLQPTTPTYVAFWGIGTLTVDGQVPASGTDRLVHGMITCNVRNANYELVFDVDVDCTQIHTHLMLPPLQILFTANDGYEEIASPVPTGFILPNGITQPFLHIMFENITLSPVTDTEGLD
ncbi:MAG: hypothetical protein ETSY1_37665 [Candidatus Entotheonella factor]|uniref:Uncharacterized protein n=1 Tax=Entotheonella factor TaxID=1429438 RepID=W4L6W2_ENTF1|nr:MAG: hypothetical protein ETSY1_37665 [Candidatus Entotheonella factor]